MCTPDAGTPLKALRLFYNAVKSRILEESTNTFLHFFMASFSLLHQALNQLGLSENTPRVQIFTPGRIEVIGKHVDYAGGSSLTCAISLGFHMVVIPIDAPQITLIDHKRGEQATFFTHNLYFQEHQGWRKYVQSLLIRLTHNFGQLNGCVITFSSNLPPASGMSSSSAFMVSLLMAIKATSPLEYHPLWRQNIQSNLDFAEYAACVENGKSFKNLKGTASIGVLGGSQDQTAICCATKNQLKHFGYLPTRLLATLDFPDDLCFVMGNTGVHAAKGDGAKEAYNAASKRVAQLTEIGQFLFGEDLKTLAQICGSGNFNRAHFLEKLTFYPELKTRFLHFEKEQYLVHQTVLAFERQSWSDVGNLLQSSQQAASSLLGNQVPETDYLAQIALQQDALASSAFGAGFGGAVWALLPKLKADTFLEKWEKSYQSQFPNRNGHFFQAELSGGAKYVVANGVR